MTARTAARGAVLTATLALAMLPSPVWAGADDGTDAGDGLSVVETLFWFVVIPGVLFVAIALLASASSIARGPRYRPGLGWWAAPVWFNGPESPDAALRAAAPTLGGGGASARW